MLLPSLIQYFHRQFIEHFQQKFLPDIFSDTWIYNSVRNVGENTNVLWNFEQLCLPIAIITSVEELLLTYYHTICENSPHENIRKKTEFTSENCKAVGGPGPEKNQKIWETSLAYASTHALP